MKNEPLIWASLVLQAVFLCLVLFLVPEQVGAINLGLQKLLAICPEAAPFSPSDTGLIKLVKPGDYFLAASGGIKFLATVAIFVSIANGLLLVVFIFCLRRKKMVSGS